MALPLDGLLVIDFSTLLPGPLCTFMLAEAGAEVIKVERPGGEDMRGFPPRLGAGSAPFAALNGGKRSLALDLKSPDARAALDPLIARADILVEQFRPGVMDRLGLGYGALRRANPRLVYCSITGYGQTGPRAQEAGHDVNYQARSGVLSLSPGSPEHPSIPPTLTADIAGGAMPAVINILLALRRRDLTGQGAHLDIAMADGMFPFGWYGLTEGFATGRFPGSQDNMLAGGSPRYRLYATRDGRFLAVGALEPKFWEAFCEGIGLPQDLRDDGRDPAATRAEIERIVRSDTADAWRERLEPLDCCCTVVASLEEAAADPHFRERAVVEARARTADGREVPAAAVPIVRELRRDLDAPRAVPEVGELRLGETSRGDPGIS